MQTGRLVFRMDSWLRQANRGRLILPSCNVAILPFRETRRRCIHNVVRAEEPEEYRQ